MEDDAQNKAILAEFEKLKLQNAEKDRLLEEKDRALEEKDRDLEENNRLLQGTTLDELLKANHEELFDNLEVQDNPRYSTLGTLTNPQGKACPRSLEPWTDFPRIRDKVFGEIRDTFHPSGSPLREFTSLKGIQDKRQELKNQHLISSEEDLKQFYHLVVQPHVAMILLSLVSIGSCPTLGDGLVFHNQSHALRDGQYEVEQRRQSENQQKKKKTYQKVPAPANADQICVCQNDDESRLVFVVEMKAPHKLTLQFLEIGLRHPIDVQEVRNRGTVSTDADEKFIENAQTLVAAAATQTYSYMLLGGIQYGCIVTGEAIVFLYIDAKSPQTLYYHLAIPSKDVQPDDVALPDYSKTAVAQLSTFAVLASRTAQQLPDWRKKVIDRADRWALDYDTLEHQLETPRNERRKSLPPSAYKARIGKMARKTYDTRSKRRDDEDDEPHDDDNSNDHSPDSSSDETDDASTPSKSQGQRSKDVSNNRKGGGQGTSRKHAQPPSDYCTQACLLGVVLNTAVDESCPNAPAHPRNHTNSSLHLIGLRTLRTLVRDQLGTTLNTNITDLKVHGARGMLFRLVLASHGYTFVSKGTIGVFVPDLKHEGAMYGRLRSFQGKDIPVYLGNIDLEYPWYDYGIRIVHMLLLSWGGHPIRTLDEGMRIQKSAFEAKLGRLGIKHGDLRAANMLWNDELQRLIFIDFERSTVQPRAKRNARKVLGEISPNKPSPMGRSPSMKKSLHKNRRTGSEEGLENKVKTAATLTIFDDENMTLQLPIPSPERLSVAQQWWEDDTVASKQNSRVGESAG
ncbi:MAG: hypothetical protein LQ346_008242 [Caloplaca aetnensis]|nr:MAG: hypothetical protein LQ346_008242 [Caloplaca aetnensis]